MKAIVGYTGFVGSNLCRFAKFDKLYNSKNFNEAMNMEFDEMYFCGMPAEKWRANKYPTDDLDTINNIKDILKTVKVKKFILISTVDVYDDVKNKHNETYDIDTILHHTYGKNRYLFERFIMNTFKIYYIFRLPALFGLGLKKNIIYDLLNNNQINNIPLKSRFQWYFLDWLYSDIQKYINNNINIINLSTEPIDTSDIVKLFPYDVQNFNTTKEIYYDIVTMHSDSGYIRNKDECMESLIKFINFESINRRGLKVSNIYPKHISQEQFWTIVKAYNIKEMQIAPTVLTDGSWDELQNIDLNKFSPIKITSLQSITYGLKYNIFDANTDDLLIHLKKVVLFCYKNNIENVVFGCGFTRNKPDGASESVFVDFFKKLGDIICETNVIIHIEPNMTKYVNFLNHIEDTAEMVLKINHPNIKLMLDIGHLDKNELHLIEKYQHITSNVDVSTNNMKPLSSETEFDKHAMFIDMLKKINYQNKINLEMLSSSNNPDEELRELNDSIVKFIDMYGNIFN